MIVRRSVPHVPVVSSHLEPRYHAGLFCGPVCAAGLNKVLRNEDKRTSCLPGLALLEACRASVPRTNMSPQKEINSSTVKSALFKRAHHHFVGRARAAELCCPAAREG
jgi:hypothetical protein